MNEHIDTSDEADELELWTAFEELFIRAKEELGLEHPDTVRSLYNFANLLRENGDHEEAEALYRRVMECSDNAYGPEHPETLKSINRLAGFLSDNGNYGEAEMLYRDVLRCRENALGPEQIDTLRSINNLG
jgi:tetratricopeptide (TPR) repeat protein